MARERYAQLAAAVQTAFIGWMFIPCDVQVAHSSLQKESYAACSNNTATMIDALDSTQGKQGIQSLMVWD
jgi:hypothetical protein